MKGTGKRGLCSGLISVLTAVALLLIIAACSSGQADNSGANADSAPAVAEKSIADQSGDSLQFSENQTAAPAAPSSSPEAPAAGNGETDSNTNSGGGVGPIADANAGFDRQVIYKANMVMKVEKFSAAQEQLLAAIHQSDAYVLQFSDTHNNDERGATYVIKVPSQGFSPFLERLGKIKTLDSQQQMEGTDVTEEFVDLAARLKAKQAVEARLLAFMDKATKTSDLISFSNELGNVQQEIERIKGRQRYLEQNVAYSTVSLRLYESSDPVSILEEKEKNFGERISDAMSGSTKALRQFGEGLVIVLAALLPVIVLAAIIAVPAFLVIRNRRSARNENAKERRKLWNTPNVNMSNNEEDPPKKAEDKSANSDD
ncbi:DUF4349 domain-containing protein [Cohnella kolymensis]|uniref:DUF4349 domain-containing protein n=1 Tax=Cohnella kolymensis TaxID=1590652 RepID=UPI000698B3BC|nr:DUF4349 domain-containing protein [Cohnella kolymensis]